MAITSVKFGTSAAGANNATYSPSQNPQIGTDLSKSYDGVVSRKTLGGTTFSVANFHPNKLG